MFAAESIKELRLAGQSLKTPQCIIKERPDGGVGWMAPPPLRYAVQGFAALRRRESKWAGEKEPQEGIGKSAGEWHFNLEEKDKRWHE